MSNQSQAQQNSETPIPIPFLHWSTFLPWHCCRLSMLCSVVSLDVCGLNQIQYVVMIFSCLLLMIVDHCLAQCRLRSPYPCCFLCYFSISPYSSLICSELHFWQRQDLADMATSSWSYCLKSLLSLFVFVLFMVSFYLVKCSSSALLALTSSSPLISSLLPVSYFVDS